MKRLMLCVAVMAAWFGTGMYAQDIAGDWQGTIHPNGKDVRILFRVTRGDKGAWSGKMFNVDVAGQALDATSVTLNGTTFKFAVDRMGITYEGKLSADGKTLTGTWTQASDTPLPLLFAKATPETAWDIPEPPKAEKPMAADADPSFDVATIKPNASGAASVQQLTLQGRNFVVRNGSLNDLITFAYGIQIKQLVGSPAWANGDRYDVDAIPDQPGQPNMVQARSMMRKLLADRYKLQSHHEKREMSAYALSGTANEKLTPSKTIQGQLPSFFPSLSTGRLTLHMVNGTLPDFAEFLQERVLDKPVVDQTGIAGRFDADLTFTPDPYMFNGHPPKLPASDVADAPDLFAAVQQQLGLKLAAEKTQVDVMVIDHVEKPSAN